MASGLGDKWVFTCDLFSFESISSDGGFSTVSRVMKKRKPCDDPERKEQDPMKLMTP